MRIIIDGFGRRLIDLELLKPLHRPAAAPVTAPDCDPHGTLASQVEQASEPAPGFGFRGSASTVMCGVPSAGGVLCRFPPGPHSHGHSWET
jgi:hypothetical protein